MQCACRCFMLEVDRRSVRCSSLSSQDEKRAASGRSHSETHKLRILIAKLSATISGLCKKSYPSNDLCGAELR